MSVHRFFTVGQAEGEYGGLILTLPSGRGVMEYQIEMAANNDIEGLMPFCHVIADGKPRFRYDVGCLVPLSRYMEQYRLDIRLAAEVLLGISSAVCGLEKYLLEEKCVILELDMVYIEPVRHSIKLVYLPVDPPDGEYTEFLTFVTELLKCVDTVDATSKLFRRRILEEVKKTGFRYETFTDFLLDIICFSGDGSGEPAGLPDARANMGVNSNAGKNPKGASGWLIGKKPRHTSTSVSAKAESSRGNQALLMPVLCGILVVIAYFGIYSVLHGAYQNAVLLVAIAAELFLLRFFVQKGNRCEVAAAVGGNMGGGAMIGGSGVGNAVGDRSGNGDNVRGSRVKKRDKGTGLKKMFGSGREKKSAPMDRAVAAAQQFHNESITAAIQNGGDGTRDTGQDNNGVSNTGSGVGGTDTGNTGSTGSTGSTVITVSSASPRDNLWEASLAEPASEVPESVSPFAPQVSSRCELPTAQEFPEPSTVAAPPEPPVAVPYGPQIATGVETVNTFCPDTEILSAGREIFASLLIREGMREYGIMLRNGGFTIGRQAEFADLVLDNPAVGKLHAKIEFDGHDWTICDLNSRNGTYLNNIRVECNTKRALKSKDMITIANADMVFHCAAGN